MKTMFLALYFLSTDGVHAKRIPDYWAIVATTPNVFVACPLCEMVPADKTDYAVRS